MLLAPSWWKTSNFVTNVAVYFPPVRNILYNCPFLRFNSILSKSSASRYLLRILISSAVITRDLRTLGRIGRNFRAASYRWAIYVIRGWIVGILSAMRGIPCAGFHVPHFAYQGTLHQTRLIRSVTRNRGAERERERERERFISRRHTELLSRVEHAKQTAMYPRINVSSSEIQE